MAQQPPSPQSGLRPPLFREPVIILRHTHHSVGLLWTKDQPIAETSTWPHTTLTKIKTSMPMARFEPATPASERPQIRALDRAATGNGKRSLERQRAPTFFWTAGTGENWLQVCHLSCYRAKAGLSHRNPSSAETFRDSWRARHSDERYFRLVQEVQSGAANIR